MGERSVRSAIRTGWFTLLTMCLAAAATAQTPFEALVVSDVGDYIGGGGSFHFVSSAPGQVDQPIPDSPGVDIRWTQDGFWRFLFTGPNGARLHVGAYDDAVRSFTATSPGMDISGQARGCNMLIGRFDVWDVSYASDGRVERLAVDAVQYCESSGRALHVYLRYGDTNVPVRLPRTHADAGDDQIVLPGATVALSGTRSVAEVGGPLTYAWTQTSGPAVTLSDAQSPAPNFVAPVPAAEWATLQFQLEVRDAQNRRATDVVTVIVSESTTPRSEIRIVSQSGETVGQGQVFQQTIDASHLRLGRLSDNGISLHYDFQPPNQVAFGLQLDGGSRREITVGNYSLAYRYPFSAASGKAGLDVTLALGCSQSTGYFTIHDVAYDELGNVTRLAADFVQYCLDTAGPVPLRGYVRINSVVPITSRAPTASAGMDRRAEPGDPVQLDGSQSAGGATGISQFAWTQVSGPTVQLAGANKAAPQFVAPGVPPQGATLEFKVIVTNVGGFSNSDTVSVHVRGTAEPRSIAYLEPTGSDFPTGGSPLWFDEDFGTFRVDQYQMRGQEHVVIWFDDVTFSTFDLSSAAGGTLAPGVYPDTDTYTETKAGFTVSSDGRACNQTIGTMTIHEIERDGNGKVIRLAADFSYRCDYDGLVFGFVRFNSTVPVVAPTLLASAGPPQSVAGGDLVQLDAALTHPGAGTITGYSWRQTSGPAVALIGANGLRPNFIAPAAGGTLEFEVTVTTSDGQSAMSIVRIDAQPAGTRRSLLVLDPDFGEPLTLGYGLRMSVPLAEPQIPIASANSITLTIFAPHSIRMVLSAPFAEPLQAGISYEGVRVIGPPEREFQAFPGFTFNFDGLQCRAPRGRFVIREMVRDSGGTITSLAVDFAQRCDPSNAWLHGAIRFNSALPVRGEAPMAAAGPDLVVMSGDSFVLDGRASSDGIEGNTTYSWRQISGPAVPFSGGTEHTALASASAPTVTGNSDIVFELSVTNSRGLTSSDTVNVKLLGTGAPATQSIVSSYDPATRRVTRDFVYDPNNSFAKLSAGSQDLIVYLAAETPLYADYHLDTPTTKFTPGIYKVGPGDFQFQFHNASEFGCSDMRGALRILRATYDGDTLKSLAFDMDVHCSTRFGYVGSVRIDAPDPIDNGASFPNAGADAAGTEGTTITLDGTKSLIVGSPIDQLSWTQIEGPSVTLTPDSAGVATFVAPQVSTQTNLRFRLDISGQAGTGAGSDTVTITINDTPASGSSSGGGGSSSGAGSSGGGGSSSGAGSSGGGGVDGLTVLALLLATMAALQRRRIRVQ